MKAFYQLSDPDELRHYREGEYVYGRPEWAKQYGFAEWADSVKLASIQCPLYPDHQRAGERLTDLVILLPSPNIGDFVWTWYGDCLITDRVLKLFQEAGLTGFRVKPVTVERVRRLGKKALAKIPQLWELVITGKGGDARPESGIRIIYRCEACGLVEYSSFRDGIHVDEEQWDGSDFFTINGYPKLILVTERVKELIIGHRLTNCVLIPAEKLRWPETLMRPEELYRAKGLLQEE